MTGLDISSDASELFAICYQISGSILLDEEVSKAIEECGLSDEMELLLNTLSRPEGPGAEYLVENHNGPYQIYIDKALMLERKKSVE